MISLFQATFDTNEIQDNHSLGFHFDGIYSLLTDINVGLELPMSLEILLNN